MTGGCFADRLDEFAGLSANERAALARVQDRERTYRRGQPVVRENDRNCELFVVERGLLMSSVVLDDGSRQILRFLFPGDLGGFGGVVYGASPETIEALGPAVICPLERGALATLFVEQPRIAALILTLNQIERVALTDRLAGLGRTSARGRVAAILLEMRGRYRQRDPAIGTTFALGLTQEEIGDATGLTAVHVNRMLRQLEDEGLIARTAGRLTIRDETRLCKAANFTDRYAGIDLGWLPPQR